MGETDLGTMASAASDTPARISIVLPTYNRQASLRRCLEALLKCDVAGLDVEVQVVDDGSSDGTGEVVRELAGACEGSIRLRYHHQANAGSGAARNLGIRRSDAAILLFIDDDCAPDPGWVQALVRGPWGPAVGAVGGKIESGEDSTWVSRYCRHIRFDEYPKYRKDGDLSHVNTANCAYRREVLDEVEGLEPSLCGGGVDIDLAQRVVARGYRLEYQPEAVVRHYHRESARMLVRTFLKRGARGYLRSMLWEERDHPTRGRQIKELYRVLFSLFELPLLPFGAARLARAGVSAGDALPFALMNWVRVQAFRCGKVRMMGDILSGRQLFERTPVETECRACSAAASPQSAIRNPQSGYAVDRRRISIVLPTFNRAASLRRCIESILSCDAGGVEVTLHVVDDGSSDATPETVRELAATAEGAVRVVYHRQPNAGSAIPNPKSAFANPVNAGSAAARNTGIAACDTDLVLFVDDDCAVEPDWIRRLVDAPWESGLGGVGGTISSAEDSTWVTRYCRHREYNAYTQADAEANHVNTANCAYLRRALLDVGGFEALLPRGMDGDLAWRVVMRGYRLECVPEAAVRHYHRERVGALARAFRATGSARVLRRALYGTPPAPAWGRVGMEAAHVVLSLRELVFLPFYASEFARRGVPWRDAVPFAYMDWLRGAANRCGRIAMMTRILTGCQRLDRTTIEPDAAAGAAGAPGWARSR